MPELSPTQDLILEVLAARYRCGETWWPFPSSLRRHLEALQDAGLISVQGGNVPKTLRAKLTGRGEAATFDLSHTATPTLAQGIDSLPMSNEDMFAWLRARGLGAGAGAGAVINAIRHDLTELKEGR